MDRQIVDLKKQLRSYQFKVGVLQYIPCSEKENREYAKLLADNEPLPAGIRPIVYGNAEVSTTQFCTLVEPQLTPEETEEYLTYKKLMYLRSIKNCMVFFTFLTVSGLIFGLLAAMGIFS